jgi:hypothetical protein
MEFIMKEIFAFVLLVLAWIPVYSASFPTEDDLRGIMSLCSQGFSINREAKGSIEADVNVLRLLKNLEAGISANGKVSKEEIGAILNKTFSEKGSIEVYKIYQECLNQNLQRLMSGGDLSGPGFQRTANFTLFAKDAQILDDTAIVAINATFHDDTGKAYKLDFDTVRAISSDGGIFHLEDDSGLSKGFSVSKNDKTVMNLIFKRSNKFGKDKPEAKLRVTGKFIRRGANWPSGVSFPIGLGDINVRK